MGSRAEEVGKIRFLAVGFQQQTVLLGEGRSRTAEQGLPEHTHHHPVAQAQLS